MVFPVRGGGSHGRARRYARSPAIFTVLKLGGVAALAAAAGMSAATAAISAVPLPKDITSGRGVYARRIVDVPVDGMEPAGIEPATSWLQTKRSPN